MEALTNSSGAVDGCRHPGVGLGYGCFPQQTALQPTVITALQPVITALQPAVITALQPVGL